MKLRSPIFVFLLFCFPILSTAQGNDLTAWTSQPLTLFKASADFPGKVDSSDIDYDFKFVKKEAIEYVDETSNTTFVLAAIHHGGMYKEKPVESFFKRITKKLPNAIKGEILRSDFLTINEQNVMRIVSRNTEEGFNVLQISKKGSNLYLQSVHHKEGDFDKAIIEQFFGSLMVEDKGEPEMYKLDYEQGAISIEMPVQPEFLRRVHTVNDYGSPRDIVINSYISIDEYQGYNYLMLYRDNPAGVVFEGTDTTLNEYQSIYEEQFKSKAKNARRILINGMHALEFSLELKRSQVTMVIILRGNRAYVLMVEELTKGSGLEDRKDAFFNSIEFLPLQFMKIKPIDLNDQLSIAFPTEEIISDTSLSYAYPFMEDLAYYSVDTLSGISYGVDDYVLSPYYTVENYDSLLRGDKDSLATLDSILILIDTVFQDNHAFYMKRTIPDTEIYLYEVLFYRGPHLFEMLVSLNKDFSDEVAWEFFNSFKYDAPEYTDKYIIEDKSAALWEALNSKDSATVDVAKHCVQNTILPNDNLPNIFDFLKKDFSFDTLTFPDMHSLMFLQLINIEDERILPFLDQLFVEKNGEPDFQKSILETFLNLESESGLELFFKHIKKFNRENENKYEDWNGFYSIRDSSDLNQRFAKEWIDLIDHQSVRYYALEVLEKLYKDTLLSLKDLQSCVPALLMEGNKIIEKYDLLNSDSVSLEGELYDIKFINDLLIAVPLTDSIELYFKKYLKMKDFRYLCKGIEAAFKTGMKVDEKIFANVFTNSKKWWYEVLKDAEEAKVFDRIPKEYFSQEIAVESLFADFYEYEADTTIYFKIIDTKGVINSGKKYQLHIVELKIQNYDYLQIGLCTQPADTDEVTVEPAYYDYTYWDKDKKSQEKVIESLIKDFYEWKPEEN